MLLHDVSSAVAKQGWTIIVFVTAVLSLGRIYDLDYPIPLEINSVKFFNIHLSDGETSELGLVLFLLHFHCLYR